MHPRFWRFSQRCWLLALACACEGSHDSTPGTLGAGGSRAASAGAGAASRPGTGGESSGGSAAQGGAGVDTSARGGASGQATGPEGESGSDSLSPRLARYHGIGGDRSLRVELDAVEGLWPDPSTLEYIAEFAGRSLDKPDGIRFDADETLAPTGADHAWTFDELDAFSREHAQDDSDGPVSIHVVFVDGSYDSAEDGGTVLGLAWGQRYIAMFQDAIRSGCSGLVGAISSEACQIAERNVWAHEIGHVIGLVDNGLPQQTQHRDPDHGRHDISDGCLMYWAYDRPAIFDVLVSRLDSGQSENVDFCGNCWADLNAARR